jgi:hypothetical protein
MRIKFLNWLIFSVIFALFPILARILAFLITSKPLSLVSLLAASDFLLITVAITTGASGSLYIATQQAPRSTERITELVVFAANIFIVMTACFCFGVISLKIPNTNEVFISIGSVVLFLCSVCISSYSIILAEKME